MNMKTCWKTVALMLAAMLVATLAGADDRYDDDYGDRDRTRPYIYGFGLGLGLVDPSDNAEDSTEPYFSASLRIMLGEKDRERARRGRSHHGVLAYIEPEIAYWGGEFDSVINNQTIAQRDSSDLMLGVNILGLVPFRYVDFFFGAGAGVHFLDSEVVDNAISDNSLDSDDTNFGVNFHVGIDVRIAPRVAVFGKGRFDLIEGDLHEEQAKIYLGLRFRLR